MPLTMNPMNPIICCTMIQPHNKPTRTPYDPKFNAFRNAAINNDVRGMLESLSFSLDDPEYIIELTRKFDLGTVESARYFAVVEDGSEKGRRGFMELQRKAVEEVKEEWVRVEAWKGFGCKVHYKMFRMGLLEKVH